jgi:hypothetical protein
VLLSSHRLLIGFCPAVVPMVHVLLSPPEVRVYENDNASFICTVEFVEDIPECNESLMWFFRRNGKLFKPLLNEGKAVNGYQLNFSVQSNESARQSRLDLYALQRNDTGEIACQYGTFGITNDRANITVLRKYFRCAFMTLLSIYQS